MIAYTPAEMSKEQAIRTLTTLVDEWVEGVLSINGNGKLTVAEKGRRHDELIEYYMPRIRGLGLDGIG